MCLRFWVDFVRVCVSQVWDSGLIVAGCGFRVSCFVVMVSGIGWRVFGPKIPSEPDAWLAVARPDLAVLGIGGF